MVNLTPTRLPQYYSSSHGGDVPGSTIIGKGANASAVYKAGNKVNFVCPLVCEFTLAR
jgi:hypothetical protein